MEKAVLVKRAFLTESIEAAQNGNKDTDNFLVTVWLELVKHARTTDNF
jgi:hypothetical protein